jgi:hypothetical protein
MAAALGIGPKYTTILFQYLKPLPVYVMQDNDYQRVKPVPRRTAYGTKSCASFYLSGVYVIPLVYRNNGLHGATG